MARGRHERTIMDDDIWLVIDDGRAAAADLLESLTPEQLVTPSWCDGWTVRDVGAHLAMAPNTKLPQMIAGMVRYRFRFNPMIRGLTLERSAARTDAQIVADLRDVVGSRRGVPGTSPVDAMLDVLVHTQDMVRPLGIEVAMPAEASAVAAEHAWKRKFPFFPERRLSGLRLVAIDTDWSRGEGREVRAAAGDLLLMTTGRLPRPDGV